MSHSISELFNKMSHLGIEGNVDLYIFNTSKTIYWIPTWRACQGLSSFERHFLTVFRAMLEAMSTDYYSARPFAGPLSLYIYASLTLSQPFLSLSLSLLGPRQGSLSSGLIKALSFFKLNGGRELEKARVRAQFLRKESRLRSISLLLRAVGGCCG